MVDAHQNRIQQLRESFLEKMSEAEAWPRKVSDVCFFLYIYNDMILLYLYIVFLFAYLIFYKLILKKK